MVVIKIFRIFANVLALISVLFLSLVACIYSLLSIFEGDYIFGTLLMFFHVAMWAIIFDVILKENEK